MLENVKADTKDLTGIINPRMYKKKDGDFKVIQDVDTSSVSFIDINEDGVLDLLLNYKDGDNDKFKAYYNNYE